MDSNVDKERNKRHDGKIRGDKQQIRGLSVTGKFVDGISQISWKFRRPCLENDKSKIKITEEIYCEN